MPGVFRLGRLGTVTISVHVTFVPLLFWAAWLGAIQYGNLSGAFFGALTILLLFVCVFAHEWAHSLQANRCGITVTEIMLLPIGGLANLEATRIDPGDEIRIALAGPLMNLALSLCLGLLLLILLGLGNLSTAGFAKSFNQPSLIGLTVYLATANLILALFNFLPAFPLDGGRALRASLSQRMPYDVATHQASRIGRGFALCLAGVGMIIAAFGAISSGSVLVLVAAGLFIGATYEDRIVARNSRLDAWQAGQVVRGSVQTIEPHQPLSAAMLMLAKGYVVPVVIGTPSRLVGLLVAADLHISAEPSLRVAHVMRTRFPSVRASDPLWVAYEKLKRSHLRAIPVMSHETLCGLVTLTDIQRTLRDGVPPIPAQNCAD